MNDIVVALTKQNFKNLKDSFDNSKEVFFDKEKRKLFHSAEFGQYRETLVRKWLRMYIPERFGIGSGFIITQKNKVSTQCDIIIYDKFLTPRIEDSENQKFYPIETVVGVLEIKSNINSIANLKSYLLKLSEFKKLREDVIDVLPINRTYKTPFDMERNPFDNIFTILICNKFDFLFDSLRIDYGDTNQKYFHNIIFSLTDGLSAYKTDKGIGSLAFSFRGDTRHKFDFLIINNIDDIPLPLISFLNSLNYLINNTCVHQIDMSRYYTNNIVEVIE